MKPAEISTYFASGNVFLERPILCDFLVFASILRMFVRESFAICFRASLDYLPTFFKQLSSSAYKELFFPFFWPESFFSQNNKSFNIICH